MGRPWRAPGHARAVLLGAAVAVVALVATPGVAGAQAVGGAQATDPPWSVEEAALAAALDCPEFAHPDREPVLLVHGTFTTGHEQFDWNHLQALPPRGFDVCVVTYPDRGLGDQQVSAEYVAHAVLAMHEATGRKVDLVGHSQGASMPRWAVRFWPSVRVALDDYVAIAGPHHGTDASPAGQLGGPMPESLFQFAPDSRFTTILDTGDETPGDLDWTNLYSRHDEVVRPVEPEPTAALDFGQEVPNVANILLQDLCPGRVVDHLTIGTTDRLVLDLVVDALSHDGPAEPDRLDLGPACSVADQVVEDPDQLLVFADLVRQGLERGAPDLHLASEEPPTRDYARGEAGPEPERNEAGAARRDPSAPPPRDTASEDERVIAGVTGPAVAAAPAMPATGGGPAPLVGLAVVALAGAVTRRRPPPGGRGRG